MEGEVVAAFIWEYLPDIAQNGRWAEENEKVMFFESEIEFLLKVKY